MEYKSYMTTRDVNEVCLLENIRSFSFIILTYAFLHPLSSHSMEIVS